MAKGLTTTITPPTKMNNEEKVLRIDDLISHIWMVRTFLKHSEEGEEDEELQEVYRDLYDSVHAVGPALAVGDHEKYLKLINKKFSKLKNATELFLEIQPEISTHTNFQMAAKSLKITVSEIGEIIGK